MAAPVYEVTDDRGEMRAALTERKKKQTLSYK